MKVNKLNYNFTESHNLSVLIIFKSGVIITPEWCILLRHIFGQTIIICLALVLIYFSFICRCIISSFICQFPPVARPELSKPKYYLINILSQHRNQHLLIWSFHLNHSTNWCPAHLFCSKKENLLTFINQAVVRMISCIPSCQRLSVNITHILTTQDNVALDDASKQ